MNAEFRGSVLKSLHMAGEHALPGRPPTRPDGSTPFPDAAAEARSVEEIRDLAQQRGFREGHEEGRRAGAEEARAEILAQAQSVIEAATAEAVRSARSQVETQLQDAAAQQWTAVRARLDALFGALASQFARRVEDAENDLQALCLEAVVSMMGEAAANPQLVRDAVLHALVRLQRRPVGRMRLNAQDLALLQTMPDWSDWVAEHAPQLEWESSADVTLGGCILESPEGGLDARLDVQLQRFSDLLREARRVAPSTSGSVQPS